MAALAWARHNAATCKGKCTPSLPPRVLHLPVQPCLKTLNQYPFCLCFPFLPPPHSTPTLSRTRYRPGRRRVGEAIPNSDEEETSQASDEGPIDITPRRLALTQASARTPAGKGRCGFTGSGGVLHAVFPVPLYGKLAPRGTCTSGKGPKPDRGSDSEEEAAVHVGVPAAAILTPGPSMMSGMFGGSEDSGPRAPPSVVTSLRGPAALQGSFVEVDETLDNPTPSPRFLKSLK